MAATLDLELLATLSKTSTDKILLLVLDGLGGLSHPDFGGQSELEFASRRGMLENLTAFVRNEHTAVGTIDPVAPGITPGSGAGHLGLFGYDPLRYRVKRGAMEAAGTANLPHADVVARVNFCKLDSRGIVVDRRAGRLGGSTSRGKELAAKVNAALRLSDVQATIVATRDHRGILCLSAGSSATHALVDDVTDTDPGEENKPVQPCAPLDPHNDAAVRTAELVRSISEQARCALEKEPDGNMVLFRGFSSTPSLPRFPEVFSVRAAGIAAYALYRGVARVVGMEVLETPNDSLEAQVELLNRRYADFDFFYFHYKKPDAKGEDKDFLGKVEALAEFDRVFPRLVQGDRFSVVAITSDHSTPSLLGRHSEHPVPLAVHVRGATRSQPAEFFTEAQCARGPLGRLRGAELMPILMAAAGKLRKFEG